MTRHILDPEAIYRVAVQQLKAERWPDSVRRASSTQWFSGQWSEADRANRRGHIGLDYGPEIFARPAARQPGPAAR